MSKSYPREMWIAGLDALRTPLLHLHTQANVELPWATIDMDFMNLNQAAHGDREFGYIQTRLGVARRTVVAHVRSPIVQAKILGAHMLEICPTLTSSRPSLEIHPLGIGGREDPVRLVFDTDPGPAVVVALSDMRDRFRLTANAVDVVPPDAPLPNL